MCIRDSSLIKQHGQARLLEEVYKACKEELTKPREERRNCVKAIYEGLTLSLIHIWTTCWWEKCGWPPGSPTCCSASGWRMTEDMKERLRKKLPMEEATSVPARIQDELDVYKRQI